MKIGIDITFLFDQYTDRGIGNYAREVISRMIADSTVTWVLFGFGIDKLNYKELGIKRAPHITFLSLGNPRPSNLLNPFYFKFKYLHQIKKAKLDLYFAPHFERGLPIGKVKTVVTMHDVIPLVTGKYSSRGRLYNLLKSLFYRYNLAAAKNADVVLTNSDFTKRELVNKAGFAAEKVKKIYLAVNKDFYAKNINTNGRDVRRTLIIYQITKPYFIYYGGLEANKNVASVLYAFQKCVQKHPDYKLVIAGKDFKVGWDGKARPQNIAAKSLLSLIEELKLRHQVIITGFIDAKHAPVLLNNASAFTHLSTYEGFGLSVLEALSAGTVVIAARRSSYPEVLGEAAYYVNPMDVNEIAAAMHEVASDEKLRQRYLNQGQAQSAKFSWAHTAEETLKVLKAQASHQRKLRIAQLITYFSPVKGGAENNSYELSRRMADEGHNVTILTSLPKDKDLPRSETLDGLKIVRFPKLNNQYYLGFYPTLLWYLLTHKFDVIHVHGFGFIWHDFCLLLNRIISRKTVFLNTPHGPFMALDNYSLGQTMIKKVYTVLQSLFLNRLYDQVIQVNPKQYRWIEKYGISHQKIHYLPNGISENYITPLAPSETTEFAKEQKLTRKLVISFVGRFEKYKGISDLLRAITTLSKTHKNVKLIAMGNEGKELAEAKNIISKNKLENFAELVVTPADNYRDQVLGVSKIFVLPSQWEAFGISILEAMAKGNAILTTRTEGGEFLIKEGENGFLFDYGDTRELALLLSKLIDDKKLQEKLIENNIEKVKDFTWEKISQDYSKLLAELTK